MLRLPAVHADATVTSSDPPAILSGLRAVPTGVMYVTTEAARLGFRAGDPSWCNLGQGQPEGRDLEGAPPRVHAIEVGLEDHEYAPIAGIAELRAAIADLYNRRYRRGLRSQYTAENVCVAGGGRAALARAAACLGAINLGHFLPDYTAYGELLEVFKTCTAIPILLESEGDYAFGADDLHREIVGRGLSAILLSNPCNPTGKVIAGDDLAGWVDTARALDCSLIFDESYAHYVYRDGAPAPVSAALHVRDVDRDPVILVDGLTKNWRYPGWRVAWAVGPRRAIEAMVSAGSFLDGGGARPVQRAAVPLLDEDHARAESATIVTTFRAKRDRLVGGLRRLGIGVARPPDGTIYVWGSVAGLPAPLDSGMGFFRAALAHGVIVVPGELFDVNPGQRRSGRASPFRRHVRFSFGPELSKIERGLGRLASLSLR